MMDNLNNLARKAVLKLIPYSSARSEIAADGIRLDANENPFCQEEGLNRYPEPQPRDLKRALAELYGVKDSQIIMTRGSDEGIDLLTRVFCEPGQDSVVVTPPTYGMYEVSASIQGVSVTPVPLLSEAGFALDKKSLLENPDKGIKLVFLCSPNNPTGNVFARADILEICEQFQGKALIVVDEAYIEFSDMESLSSSLSRYDNLVILRTLSKAYGLAGARMGCILANQAVVDLLKKIIAPYPIPVPVVKAVLPALSRKNLDWIRVQIQSIRKEREILRIFLASLSSVVEVYPSEANFLLVKVQDANRWMSLCRQHHIVIRSRTHMPELRNCVRISIGTDRENQRLREVLSYV
ncbi:Histidinol-phosphate aminotransferase (Imidazole acetol-phosphate transaminase) [Legionella londiniensis]|uniref:Histidinol-phosphate aminotransferase n=2 Tax=Legionella londiniensis TaxID=45068 RepID=A0A0W0VQX6_9GAMM|nr:Histidinol-phosphate aminotransferase (Imidazole acetol-phosphate transaminase) [Legionella londiniensis]STX92495.1 Histidinol-phosphate aminotransferase (Imidazole acetol-phosphate transaminase) [Legionella londiniensis]